MKNSIFFDKKEVIYVFRIIMATVFLLAVSVNTIEASSQVPEPSFTISWSYFDEESDIPDFINNGIVTWTEDEYIESKITIYNEYEGQIYSDFIYGTVISFPNGVNIKPSQDYRFLMINGSIMPDAEIIIKNDRTLVPVRVVNEKLDAEVSWDDITRQITIKRNNSEIIMTVGSALVAVNGQNVTIDAPAELVNNRAYVPLRFIAEIFGATVGYYDKLPFNYFPVVWIDSEALTSQQAISKEESVESLKKVYLLALEDWLAEYEGDGSYAEDNISQKTCDDEFSRFWVIDNALVDKFTEDIFYFRGSGFSFWIDKFSGTDSIGNLYFSG